jgi:hypothetical protein
VRDLGCKAAVHALSANKYTKRGENWGGRKDTYVCVSCVAMHVSSSPTPAAQSRAPSGVSSSVRGGIDTMGVRACVRTAPSMSVPAKKQTRKSCLGTWRQELKYDICKRSFGRRTGDPHIPPSGARSGISSVVYSSPADCERLNRWS